MTDVAYSRVLNVSADRAWAVIGDFGSLPRWFPFVATTELRGGGAGAIGTVRVNRLEDGGVVEERLLDRSEGERRLSYDIVAAELPTLDYRSTIEVREISDEPESCFVLWTASFAVAQGADPDSVAGWVRDGIFRTCLGELERVLGGATHRDRAEDNRRRVRDAFDDWAAGGSGFLDLLDEQVEWTIAGSGPSARTLHGRQAFLDEAFAPIARRFAAGMKPKLLGLYAEGDEVVVRWDGAAPMSDGQTYRNSYAWFFAMRDGKVVKATAFLDLATYEAALAGRRLPAWPAA